MKEFAIEAAGSPQLMQSICLNTCFMHRIGESAGARSFTTIDKATRERVLEQTAVATDYRTPVQILQKGPKTRGTDRTPCRYVHGGEGDVYVSILRAVAADPPQLSFQYDDIMRRVEQLCEPGSKPVGSSIVGSLNHMARIVQDFPGPRVFDWDGDKGVLDIPDPYLLFYLRWSGHFRGAFS